MIRPSHVSAVAAAVLCLVAFAPAAPAQGYKVGLVDMAKVFEQYEKFKSFREGLQKELQVRESEMKQLAAQIQNATKELQTSPLKKDSPGYAALENRVIQLNADAKTKQATIQREFLRKESQMYKEIYLEVEAMIAQAAKFYKCNLVIRFRREGVDDEADAQKIMQGMNRLVLYHDPADDLTDKVIAVLNRNFKVAQGGGNTPN